MIYDVVGRILESKMASLQRVFKQLAEFHQPVVSQRPDV